MISDCCVVRFCVLSKFPLRKSVANPNALSADLVSFRSVEGPGVGALFLY